MPLGGGRNVDRRQRGEQCDRHGCGLLIDAEKHRRGEAERQSEEPQYDVASPHTTPVRPLSHTVLNSSIAAAFVLALHLLFFFLF